MIDRIPDCVELVDVRPYVARGVMLWAAPCLAAWLVLVTVLAVAL